MSNIAILDWKFCDDWLIKTVMSNFIPDFETNLNFGLVTCAIRPDFHSHLLLKYLIVFKSTVNRSFFKLFFVVIMHFVILSNEKSLHSIEMLQSCPTFNFKLTNNCFPKS